MAEEEPCGGALPTSAGEFRVSPAPADAARILRRYGGDRSSASRTGRAIERFFSAFQRRFNPLFGRSGYRALIEHAHFASMRDHPLLENWRVRREGPPCFDGLSDLSDDGDPEEVWEGAVSLTGNFLGLIGSLARRGEMDGLEQAGPWKEPGPGRESGSGFPGARKGGGTRSRVPWRVLVMDRDLTTCQAIAQSLDDAPDFRVVDFGFTAEEVKAKVEADAIDFVVASGHLPVGEVIRLCRWIRREPAGKVPKVVISGLPEDYGLILRFLEAGAAAVTLGEFSVEGLRMNIRLLARGEAILPLRLQHIISTRLSELAELVRDRGLDPETLSSLSARELEVLELLEEGLTNRQTAQRLFISEGTVKSHVHQILKKLRVRDREEAVLVLRLERASRGALAVETTRKGSGQREPR
ncbi:MAG: response regulator transcription factor [Longimicrobiales bacterium]